MNQLSDLNTLSSFDLVAFVRVGSTQAAIRLAVLRQPDTCHWADALGKVASLHHHHDTYLVSGLASSLGCHSQPSLSRKCGAGSWR
jgi:hypothetical protein